MKAILAILSLTAMVSMILAQPSSSNSVRFVNAIEGSTITIYSNKLNDINLAYQATTAYFPIADGTIQITNILDQDGNSLTNGVPLLTSFGPYHTLVAVINEAETDPTKKFLLVLFNETKPTAMDSANTDSSKAWLRMMDFSQSVKYITLASQAGAIAQYIGFLQTTPYTALAASTSQLRFYNSETQTYNTPSLLVDTSFSGANAYTIMFFTSSTGVQSAVVVNDRAVGSGVVDQSTTTSGSMTTAPVAGSTTTGSPSLTTQSSPMMTTGSVPMMTTRSPIGVNNNENGSEKLAAFGLVSLIAIAALF